MMLLPIIVHMGSGIFPSPLCETEPCSRGPDAHPFRHASWVGPNLLGLRAVSFDHLVGAAEQWPWEGDVKGGGCLQIEKQLNCRDLMDRQIRRRLALQYASGINASLTVGLHKTASVAHQAAGNREVARLVDRRHSVADSQRGQPLTAIGEEGIRGEHEPVRPQL